MQKSHARVLVALHAELLTKADRLQKASWRRENSESELLADQAAEALGQAVAIEAVLAAAGADVEAAPPGQLALLSLGEPCT